MVWEYKMCWVVQKQTVHKQIEIEECQVCNCNAYINLTLYPFSINVIKNPFCSACEEVKEDFLKQVEQFREKNLFVLCEHDEFFQIFKSFYYDSKSKLEYEAYKKKLRQKELKIFRLGGINVYR